MEDRYNSWSEIRVNLEKLWNYESLLLLSRINFFLSRYPNWGPSSITEHVFSFRSEYQFDGSKLHLSENSQIDLLKRNGVNVVIDIKTGEKKGYHYLTVAGYALALESSPSEIDKLDIGCVMYINFPSRREPIPQTRCEFYPLHDAYRQDFIEELKQKINWYAQNK